MNTIHVSVTQEDINDGRRGDCRKCPVALALKRAMPDADDVSVGSYNCYVTGGTYHGIHALPHIATAFIADFDSQHGLLDEPFEFEMTLTPRE